MYKILVACLLLSSLMFANLKEISKTEISKIEQLELLKRNDIKVLKAFDAGDLYILSIQVKGQKDEIFLTKDKNYVISGAVINAKTGSQLAIPVDLSITKDKEAFVYGNGKEEFILFTDPECMYCKKFESYLPQIKDKIKIKVFFYPLDFHENAKDLSLYILSQKTTQEKIDAMFEFNIGDDLSKVKNAKYSKNELKKLETKLIEHINLGQTLNVQGTPALFDKNGNSVIWVELLNRYGIEVK
ncbi:DsbC family protein [Aliarcobacter lanthieri]|uniref:DsbC family protein n=1 Tax=Aliarcobacter lanthieri TaxID=1355374 RepID=UPI00047D1630|nr:DsbC family protein [Aliarcobacter lanthieri]